MTHNCDGERMVGLTENHALLSWLILMLWLWLMVIVWSRPIALQWAELMVL